MSVKVDNRFFNIGHVVDLEREVKDLRAQLFRMKDKHASERSQLYQLLSMGFWRRLRFLFRREIKWRY